MGGVAGGRAAATTFGNPTLGDVPTIRWSEDPRGRKICPSDLGVGAIGRPYWRTP